MQQRTIENARINRSHLSSGVRTAKDRTRHQQNKATKTRVRKSVNGFLTFVFKPIPIGLIDPLYAEENYKHLYNSVCNYARLLGQHSIAFAYDPMDFESPYRYLSGILPPDQECRLTAEEDNRLRLWVYDVKHADNILYHLPCSLIDRCEGHFRDILICFFALLQQEQALTPLKDSSYFEYIQEEILTAEEGDLDEEWEQQVMRYFDGDIALTLDLITQKPCYSLRKLTTVLKSFVPNNCRESRLRTLMLEGLSLLKQKLPIRSYAIPPDMDEDYAYTVDIDNVIQIIYDADAVSESYEHFLNECAQESGFEHISAGWVELTPELLAPLKPSTYVRNFMNWLKELNNELYYA